MARSWRGVALWVALAAVATAESWPHAGVVAAGVVWAALAVATARRWPGWSLAVGASAGLVPLAGVPGTDVWPVLVSATAGLLAGRRMAGTIAGTMAAAATFAGVAGLGLVVAVVTGDAWSWFPVGSLLLFFGVLPWLAGRYLRLRATLAAAGWERAEHLERERRLLEREARLRERTRIARDMHDSLGHHLSLIAMQAGALELDDDLAERHRAAISGLRSASVDATDRLHDIITILRDADDAPAGESIDDLVARVRASTVDVELVRSGSGDAVPAAVERTAYRVVREALTNAVKHAPGAPVTVRLTVEETHVSVAVRNGRPTTVTEPARGGGTGLAGLRERVRLVGGALHAGGRADGFEVVAELPYAGAARVTDDATTDAEASDSALHRSGLARTARRGMAAAVTVPVAIGAAIAVLLLGMRWYEVTHSYLGAGTYDELRLGDERVAGLPRNEVDGRPDVPEPPVPPGARCEYYRMTRDLFTGPIDVYRLCFVDGRLVDKTVVPGTAR